MKRYLSSRHELERIYESPIYCGVSIKGKYVNFDFNEDSSTDIVKLKNQSYGEYDDDGVTYIYGYSYTSNARKTDTDYFRDFIKGRITPRVWTNQDVEDFIRYGVLAIEQYMNFSDFGAIVNLVPRETSSTVGMIRRQLMEYIETGTIQFHMIKQAYRNVTFDADLAADAMRKSGHFTEDDIRREIAYTIKKFNELKAGNKLFEIKRFIPKELRAGFLNYFKFKSEEERAIFEKLQGVNVLIYDDFLTSGSTIKEVIRYLRAINNNNTLTVFVLVKQH